MSAVKINLAIGYEIFKSEDLSILNDKKYLKNWDTYIKDLLTSSHICDAAIYDLKGHLLGSSRSDFSLSPEEFDAITNGYLDNNIFRNKGISVNGVEYKLSYCDGRRGVIAKTGFPASGCSICKTDTLLLIGVHNDTMKSDLCNESIMHLGDFFITKDM